MKYKIIERDSFQWIDVVDPSHLEIEELAKEYNLHETSVEDCLNPEHLPKFEKIGKYSFIVLRAFDEASHDDSDSVQELTRKVAVFYNENVLISIHRKDQDYLKKIRETWKIKVDQKEINEVEAGPLFFQVLHDVILGVVLSFDRPIENSMDILEKLEMGVFDARGAKPFAIEEGYYLKRKASVFKRMLRFTMDILPKINSRPDTATFLQNLKEEAEVLYIYTDDLTESINALLNLHISLSTQKTTEASHQINMIMRVLTIFSVFLLPLNLITGIYGMNFEFMPELKWSFGYPFALFFMVFIEGAIYLWFRKQGWLWAKSK